MKIDTMEINGIKYFVKIYYEDRKNSTVSIGKKAIHIRLPLFLNREERAREEFGMKLWARKEILENPDKYTPKTTREYRNGEILKIGSEEYRLHITFKDKESSSARMDGQNIYLVISSNLPKEREKQHISALLSRIIARKRLTKLKERVLELNNRHFQKDVRKIFFKNNKSNWGSCSEKGNINISTRLLFAPDGVLEYVCIHELAHLTEFNHSNRFWALVETAMPDYKEKELWLDQNGNLCGF